MANRNGRGTASAVPRTVRPSARTVTQDPKVLNWVRKQMRLGVTSKRLVALSQTAPDWPLPGRPLSDGSLSTCYCVIYHLEEQGAKWPLEENGDGLGGRRKQARVTRKLRRLSDERTDAQREGRSAVAWQTRFEITKLTGLLTGLELDELELDQHGLDQIGDLYTDMVFLEDWVERMMTEILALLGEQGVRRRIVGLRAMTVANGCTREEEAACADAADRLERKLSLKLPA